MKLKKKELKNNVVIEEQLDKVVENIRKSQISAANEFEYKKLIRENNGFLDCSIEEDKESIIISYDIHNLNTWTFIKKEKLELIMSALMDVGRLHKIAELYKFSLNPTNIYYDIQGRAFIKTRDVYGAEEEFSNELFVRQYKSLIGCTLTKKYKFEDYDNGGQDLLKEDRFLNEIFECTEVEQIIEKLYGEYLRYREVHKEKFVEISKVKNKGYKVTVGITSLLIIVSMVLMGYFVVWERPYNRAVIAANEAYLQSNYSMTIEKMENVSVDRMNIYEKYILAVSCVKCESFNEENRRNILNTIALNGDEKVMEYWIYINRLDTEKAADIAMQESSNQLLYYAYLKEKAVIENDSSLTGQEKSTKLSSIENKLAPLENEYSTLTEE